MVSRLNRILTTAALLLALCQLGAGPANAAVESRLGGRAVYDTDLDITWLAEANDLGFVNFSQASNWVAALSVEGVTGWRLPRSLQPDPNCTGQDINLGYSFGYNCTGSELGHLFYIELGGVAGTSILTTHNHNLALFPNLLGPTYWTGTEECRNGCDSAWGFDFNDGGTQGSYAKVNTLYVMAVRGGDVYRDVPEPGTLGLISLAIAGLALARRRMQS